MIEQDTPTTIGQVVAREHARCHATGQRDWATLQEILAEEFTYTHTNGLIEDRAEYLAGLHTRRLAIRRLEMDVRLFGDIAVATGTGEFTLTLEPGRANTPPRLQVMIQSTLEVWQHQGMAWRLIAFQGTRQA
jgi:hypothetical protein